MIEAHEEAATQPCKAAIIAAIPNKTRAKSIVTLRRVRVRIVEALGFARARIRAPTIGVENDSEQFLFSQESAEIPDRQGVMSVALPLKSKILLHAARRFFLVDARRDRFPFVLTRHLLSSALWSTVLYGLAAS